MAPQNFPNDASSAASSLSPTCLDHSSSTSAAVRSPSASGSARNAQASTSFLRTVPPTVPLPFDATSQLERQAPLSTDSGAAVLVSAEADPSDAKGVGTAFTAAAGDSAADDSLSSTAAADDSASSTAAADDSASSTMVHSSLAFAAASAPPNMRSPSSPNLSLYSSSILSYSNIASSARHAFTNCSASAPTTTPSASSSPPGETESMALAFEPTACSPAAPAQTESTSESSISPETSISATSGTALNPPSAMRWPGSRTAEK
mmetsp:Transcript_23587/g.46962  ORF Transcript_23587/g.46962 Transcript_23587/m.46962 type:complete len:263 (+) Transcript_23587:635-1423(+)